MQQDAAWPPAQDAAGSEEEVPVCVLLVWAVPLVSVVDVLQEPLHDSEVSPRDLAEPHCRRAEAPE